MAQLVARLNGIQKVRGSNPLSSTIKNLIQCIAVRFFILFDLSLKLLINKVAHVLEVVALLFYRRHRQA